MISLKYLSQQQKADISHVLGAYEILGGLTDGGCLFFLNSNTTGSSLLKARICAEVHKEINLAGSKRPSSDPKQP